MRRLYLAGVLIVFLISSGCSTGDSRRMAQTNLTLKIENSRFYPQKWFIPSGADIHLQIENPSGDLHNLVILKGQFVGETDPNVPENQYWTVSINQKEMGATFQAPAMPGEYRIVCSIDYHQENGERGTLVVVIP